MENTNLQFVTNERLNSIVDQYGKKEYESEDLIDCYTIDETTKKYVSCINSTGDCWVDEYDEYSTMIIDIFDTVDSRCDMFAVIDDTIYRLKWADDEYDLALRHESAISIVSTYRHLNLLNKDECLALLGKIYTTFVTELHKIVDEKSGE